MIPMVEVIEKCFFHVCIGGIKGLLTSGRVSSKKGLQVGLAVTGCKYPAMFIKNTGLVVDCFLVCLAVYLFAINAGIPAHWHCRIGIGCWIDEEHVSQRIFASIF